MEYWLFGMPGAGKSHLGRIFSRMAGYRPYDGDDFHTSDDRQAVAQWTFTLADRHAQLSRIREAVASGKVSDAIITHPLPDRESRARIRDSGGILVYVKVPVAVALERLANEDRNGHHFRPEQLEPWIRRHWQEPDDEKCFIIQNDRHESLIRPRLRQLHQGIY